LLFYGCIIIRINNLSEDKDSPDELNKSYTHAPRKRNVSPYLIQKELQKGETRLSKQRILPGLPSIQEASCGDPDCVSAGESIICGKF